MRLRVDAPRLVHGPYARTLRAIVALTTTLFIGRDLQPAHAQSLELTDLGSLGGQKAAAYGINEAGLVVGASLDARPRTVAFVKRPGQPMVGLLADQSGRNAWTEAVSVNAYDEVLVTAAFRSSHVGHDLYVFHPEDGLFEVPFTDDLRSAQPVGIDDDGRIIVNGVELDHPETVRAWFEQKRTALRLSPPTYAPTRLPELWEDAPVGTSAVGMNGRGDVVGGAPDEHGTLLPVLWEAETLDIEVLPTPRGPDGAPTSGVAHAINDHGTIVGRLYMGADTARAVVWRGPEHALEVLGEGTPHAINNHDVVVGDRLWDLPRGRVVPLGTTGSDGWVELHDINDLGVAVGAQGDHAIQATYLP